MAKIKATQVTDNYYVGVTTLADIRGNCPDPKRVDLSTEAQRKADFDLGRAYESRGANQRQFNKARIDRAIAYAVYIDRVDNKEILGGYPPITLWTNEDCAFEDGHVIVPGAAVVSASDGETQLAARYILAAKDPTILDRPFPITLTTNCSKEAAMQTLHDMNHYATPVSEKETAALNIEGPLTKAINRGIQKSGRDGEAIIKPRGEKVTKGYLTTQIILLYGAVASLHGKDGFLKSPVSLLKKDNAQFSKLNGKEDIASDFISKVLVIDDKSLAQITSDHMMALGAKFSDTGVLSNPLSQTAYRRVDESLRRERGGKRATVQVRAAALYDYLQ